MERVNGFLDLDSYFRKLRTTGYNTDDLIIQSDCYDNQYWLKINGEKYYFKTTFSLYEELVVSECAKHLGINSVSYDLAIFKGIRGVISKSFRKNDCNYISGRNILQDYLTDQNNYETLINMGCDISRLNNSKNNISDPAEYIHTLEIVWQALEYRYNKIKIKPHLHNIMTEIITHFCLDLIVGQFDGYPQNWEVEESKTGVCVMPYFDGSASLGILKGIPYPRQSLTVNFNDKHTNNYRILEEFLKVSSTEYINMFLEYFNRININEFLQILGNVESKINAKIPDFIKDRMIQEFYINYISLEEIIDKCIKKRTL